MTAPGRAGARFEPRGGARTRTPFQALRDAVDARDARRSQGRELVLRANQLSIFDVLEDFFGVVAPREGTSYKSYCPFAFEHPDGGLEKGFRTYPATNTAYCFVMHGWLDPVRLMCIREDSRPYAAARRLLDHYGVKTDQSYAERYADLVKARETTREELGHPAYFVEALNRYLMEAVPEYESRQFDTDVATVMEAELGVLDDLLADKRTKPADVREWYADARSVIAAAARQTPGGSNEG